MPKPMRICHLSAEFAPLAKTGGLADVLGALSRYLHGQGHDVRPFLPFYSSIDTHELELTPVEGLQKIPLTLGEHHFDYSIIAARLPHHPLKVYLS